MKSDFWQLIEQDGWFFLPWKRGHNKTIPNEIYMYNQALSNTKILTQFKKGIIKTENNHAHRSPILSHEIK